MFLSLWECDAELFNQTLASRLRHLRFGALHHTGSAGLFQQVMQIMETLDLDQVKQAGWDRGYSIARYNTDCLSDGMDIAEAEEKFKDQCFEAESGNRDFSPFEFTAKTLNDAENSEEAWETFDAAIADGISAYWDRVCLKQFTFFS